jgi:hypothetical protein
MSALDALIDSQHRAAQAAEDDARAIIKRMQQIPGMERFLASGRRTHGQVPNPYQGAGNLTAIGLLERHDAPLASYLAKQVGKSISAPDYSRLEAEAQRQQQVERMKAATAELQATNAAHRQHLDRAFVVGVSPTTGRRW